MDEPESIALLRSKLECAELKARVLEIERFAEKLEFELKRSQKMLVKHTKN